jgi:hypothetical protein
MSVHVLLKFEKVLGAGVLLTLGVMGIHAQKSSSPLSPSPRFALQSKNAASHGVSVRGGNQNPQPGPAISMVNDSIGRSSGSIMAALANDDDSYTGGALSLVNSGHTGLQGWPGGLVNHSEGTVGGLQSGWVNYSEDVHGVQFGLINCTEKLRGAQVGLLNLALNNPCFKEFPNRLATGDSFISWSF